MESLSEFFEKNIKPNWSGKKEPLPENSFEPNNFTPDLKGIIGLIGAIYIESKKPVQNDELDKLFDEIARKRKLREGSSHKQIKVSTEKQNYIAEDLCRIIPLFPKDPRCYR